jgi:hypothetical protein
VWLELAGLGVRDYRLVAHKGATWAGGANGQVGDVVAAAEEVREVAFRGQLVFHISTSGLTQTWSAL